MDQATISREAIPQKQTAVVTPKVGPTLGLQIKTIDVRLPEPGEVVVRIAWTGLCGSDASFCVGPLPGFPTHNHIAGHEGIGHIVASHDPSLLRQPVAARYLTYSCQQCRYCLRGLPESCPKSLAFPKDFNGTFQQFITVPVRAVIQLPPYVFEKESEVRPSVYATALCSGSAALKALRAARPEPNDVIVVFGIAGAIGHLVGLLAKRFYAAKVIGVDVGSKEGDLMFSDGDICDRFVAAPEGSLQEVEFRQKLLELCSGLRGQNEFRCGAASVIAAANNIGGFENLADYVCDGGAIIIVGGPSEGTLSFPLQDVRARQIRIQGTLMGGNAEIYQCLDYIRTSVLKPRVTEISMEDIPQYMANFKNVGKVVARINGPLD